jgi:hypothetical protein
MKPITVGFRIPSLREACEHNDSQRSSGAAAAVQKVAIPYAAGKSTLQLTGIHVRLQPLKPQQRSNSAASSKVQKCDAAASSSSSSSSSAPAVVGAIAADIVVHAHVRGESSNATQCFVIAVVPVRYDASHNVDDTTAAGGGGSGTASFTAAASYDKRVLNAQAREARRGVVAPMFPSSFAKVDLRTQMERVQLSFTVVPVGRLSTGVVHHGKRSRGDVDATESQEQLSEQPQPTLVDCLLDVTVVGTVSAIA